MKLNLGCGPDRRPGYTNVDFLEPADQLVDLSQLPWPWSDNSVDEVLMLDFLEHFSYRMTDYILGEVWRILKPNATVEVQVPDFDHCARAAMSLEDTEGYQCNRCGNWIGVSMSWGMMGLNDRDVCTKCGQTKTEIEDAAIHRLYGGQDRKGNWHFTAFTQSILERILKKNGFDRIEVLEEKHQLANWNIKLRAHKQADGWGE